MALTQVQCDSAKQTCEFLATILTCPEEDEIRISSSSGGKYYLSSSKLFFNGKELPDNRYYIMSRSHIVTYDIEKNFLSVISTQFASNISDFPIYVNNNFIMSYSDSTSPGITSYINCIGGTPYNYSVKTHLYPAFQKILGRVLDVYISAQGDYSPGTYFTDQKNNKYLCIGGGRFFLKLDGERLKKER